MRSRVCGLSGLPTGLIPIMALSCTTSSFSDSFPPSGRSWLSFSGNFLEREVECFESCCTSCNAFLLPSQANWLSTESHNSFFCKNSIDDNLCFSSFGAAKSRSEFIEFNDMCLCR